MKSSFPGLSSLLAMGMLVAFEARAQAPSADTNQEKEKARGHFERGVAFAREGKLEAAVEEFDGAYRARPHYSVLFNLAQARAAMGDSVEAVDAFRRYLDEGGAAVDDARRTHVQGLIAFHEKRIGSLELVVEPDGAEIWVDGRLLGTSPLSHPVKLVEGTHGVTVQKSGFVPLASSVVVKAGSTAELTLRAEQAGATKADGLVLLRCAVPDVEVSIGEKAGGVTSGVTTFRAPLGQTTVVLSRSGYVADTHRVDVSPARPTEIECRLVPDGKGPRGSLRVRSRPANARVFVDGKPHRGEALPVGRHAVRVERSGYHPFSTIVRIEPGNTAQLPADLRPTKAQEDAWQANRSSRTTWAIATTIGGVALAGAAAATYVWNTNRYDDWVDDRVALDAKLAQGPSTPALLDANESLNRRSVSIDRVDVLAAGLGVASAVVLGVSGALWVQVVDGAQR